MENKFIRKKEDGTPFSGDMNEFLDGITDEDGKISTDVVLTEAQMIQEQSHAPMVLADEEADPHVPLADMRIERFLLEVVENGLNKPHQLLQAYIDAGFVTTGISYQDKNSMRFMMDKKRVRERLKYLRRLEWELQKPSRINIKNEYDKIIDDHEIKPSDKLRALEGLTKLLDGDEVGEQKTKTETTVIFNAVDKPRAKEVQDTVIDAIAKEIEKHGDRHE